MERAGCHVPLSIASRMRRVCEQAAAGRPDRASGPLKLSGDESRFAIGI